MSSVLVVNAGSTSLKLRLLHGDELVRSVDLDSAAEVAAAAEVLAGWPRPDCVAHRVVHGGATFRSAVLVDHDVEQALHELTALAPLHQPASLRHIAELRTVFPGVPVVACFDTAFHASMPAAAATYAVPREWREQWGVRRYGFHGLSHAYCARRAAELVRRAPEDLRIVTCHLGGGASLTAVAGGRSVDTTMGFTPLEGLVMATRSGTIDPGLVLWLQQQHEVPSERVSDLLEHHSGLVGLAGTGDMREVIRRAGCGDDDARLAFDVYVHRLVAGLGAMAAALGGVDVIAFTGGVGEHAPTVRQRAVDTLGWLGAAVDHDANAAAGGDADITRAGAPIYTVVVSAREDLQMAAEARQLLR